MTLEKFIFVSGLSIDIIGAYFLAQGFITKNLEALTYEGTPGLGGVPNLRYIASMIAQKSEAWVGFSCLLLGFSVQIVGYFLEGIVNFELFSKFLVGTSIFGLCIIVYGLAKGVASLLLGRYRKKMARLCIEEFLRSNEWIVEVAKHLLPNLKMENGENTASFAARVKKELNIE